MPRLLNQTMEDIKGYKGMGFAESYASGNMNPLNVDYSQLYQETSQAAIAQLTPSLPITGSVNVNVGDWLKKNWLWLVIGGGVGLVLFQRRR